jgi:hypothetical protein
MLALFLNHPPLFVAGEIALGLSLALFVGALIPAVIRGVPRISRLREPGHLNPTIVRQSVDEAVHGHPMFRGALATTRWFDPGRDPRYANKASSVGPTRSRQRAVSPRKFLDKPLTSRNPPRSLFGRSGGGQPYGLDNGRGSLIGTSSSRSALSTGV